MNTKNNWLQYFYVDEDFTPSADWIRQTPNQQCSMLLTPYIFEPDENLWDSCVKTAREMSKDLGKITVMYSGGLDSEYAVHAFQSSGYDFDIVSIEWFWKDRFLNGHDLAYVDKFETEYGKKVNRIKFDLSELFLDRDRWTEISKKYQVVSPHQQALCCLLENINDPWLQVDELETLIHFDINQIPYWGFEKREDQDMCWRKFNKLTSKKMLNNFFTYRLETLECWTKNHIVKNLADWKVYGKLSFTSSKHRIYQESCPMKMQIRPKYFGMELITSIWENNIVDQIDMLEINDHMYFPLDQIDSFIQNTKEYSYVPYKNIRKPVSI
jgi:hypothetical protein